MFSRLGNEAGLVGKREVEPDGWAMQCAAGLLPVGVFRGRLGGFRAPVGDGGRRRALERSGWGAAEARSRLSGREDGVEGVLAAHREVVDGLRHEAEAAVQAALRRLERLGVVAKDDDGWRIADDGLRAWLAHKG